MCLNVPQGLLWIILGILFSLIRRNLFAPGGSMSPRVTRAGHIYRQWPCRNYLLTKQSKLPAFSYLEIHLLLLPCSDSFTVAYWLLLSSLLGPISSGLMHLKRNKGSGGSQTSFSPLLTGTAPFYHASSPTKTPQNQTLTPFKCLTQERGRFQLPFPSESPPLIHWFGLTVSWTFCLLKLLKETLMLPADCSPLLCVDSLFLTVNAELMRCCFIRKEKTFFFFFNENGTFRCLAHCWLSSVPHSQFHLPIYSSSKFYEWSANAKANLIRFKFPQEFSSHLHVSEICSASF